MAAAALVACGDDGGDDASDEPDGTTSTTSATAADCVEAVREQAPDEAAAAFPDVEVDVEWTVVAVEEGGLGMELAELEPSTDAVGHPSFRFVFGCGGDEPELLAVYALEGDDYVLLSTTDAAEGSEFAPTLDP
jgi:hypothetical protein